MRLHTLALLCLIATPLLAGNRHSLTSTSPVTGKISLQLHSEKIDIDLDAQGVTYETSPEGYLTRVSFPQENLLYVVTFHPATQPHSEKVALIQRFSFQGANPVLSGATQSYDPEGVLLSESNWQNGLLDGPQKLYSSDGILIEERYYEAGFPVKNWVTYYENGQKANETAFPENLDQWTKTSTGETTNETTAIAQAAFKHPVEVKEIWYNEDGKKQRESSYRACKDGTQLVVDAAGDEKYFDEGGTAVRTVNRKDRITEDHRVLELGGLLFHTDLRAVDGKTLYRSEYRTDSP